MTSLPIPVTLPGHIYSTKGFFRLCLEKGTIPLMQEPLSFYHTLEGNAENNFNFHTIKEK